MIENDEAFAIKLYHKSYAESSKIGKNPSLDFFAAKSRIFF